MKFVLVFVSPNGTTKISANVLSDVIVKNNHDMEAIDLGNAIYRKQPNLVIEKLKYVDIVGFGSPVCHMDVIEPMKKLLKEMVKMKNTHDFKFKAFVFINYAGITSGKSFINTVKLLKQIKVPVIGGLKIFAPHFHHKEKFPTDDTKKIIEEFYFKMLKNKYSEIEWKKAKKVFSPEKSIVNIIYPFVHIIGKKRELSININSEKCKKCNKCINECPVGAINLKSIVSINTKKCIHCYHCTVACLFKAVESPIEKMDDMIKMNKKIIGMENPLNKIII